MFTCSEQLEDKVFGDRRSLFYAEPTEIHTYGTSAKDSGNWQYFLRRMDVEVGETEIAILPALQLNSALAETDAYKTVLQTKTQNY